MTQEQERILTAILEITTEIVIIEVKALQTERMTPEQVEAIALMEEAIRDLTVDLAGLPSGKDMH